MLQQTLCCSISNIIQSATFVKIFVHFELSITNIPTSSQIPKLPISDMLTKFEFCAYLGIIDSTLQDCSFHDDEMRRQCQITFRTFRSNCKNDFFNILPKSPTFAKCHVDFSCYTYRHIFHTFSQQ